MKTMIVTSRILMSAARALKNCWLDISDTILGLVVILMVSTFIMSWCVDGFDRYVSNFLSSF
jgi:hypothetical protein